MMNNTLNVALSANDNFAPHMGVCIKSLLENNISEFDFINIYILDCEISQSNIDKLQQLVDSDSEKSKITMRIIDVCELVDKINHDFGRFSQATWGRCFLADILEDDIERVLYLDSDCVVYNSLKELYDIDLEDNIVAAAADLFQGAWMKRLSQFEINKYINTGVLLIDLTKWRDQGITEQLVKYANEYAPLLLCADQDIINILLNDKIKKLPLKNNVLDIMYYRHEKYLANDDDGYLDYTIDEIKDARNNPVVIHFAGGANMKPWNKYSPHPLQKTYLKYRDLTPWKNDKLLEMKFPKTAFIKRRLRIVLAAILPYKIGKTLFKGRL